MSRISKCEYPENGESYRKIVKYDFYRGWYLSSNGTIANVALRDIDVNFKGQTFQVAILLSKGWIKQEMLLQSV